MAKRQLRLGMVGGGKGAFIGEVHRIAARIDNRYRLVAGALSSSPEKARISAEELGLSQERSYGSYQEMAEKEAQRDDGIDVVSIVTPNHKHYPVAKAFLEAGIHVICDKPLTSSLEDAEALYKLVKERESQLFVLTHNYTGYPVVREAREMVAKGELGTIRLVDVRYIQDWLTEPVELQGVKQAEWRTDPKRSGIAGCIGDIGTHAANLAEFIVGQRICEVSADVSTFVDGRLLDDNANMLIHFDKGAKGSLWCSQVAVGCENGLAIGIYGDKGSLRWEQENPNVMTFTPFQKPPQLITRGGAGAIGAGSQGVRVPPGHPEGYLEGFATIYTDAAELISAAIEQKSVDKRGCLPTIDDGLCGIKFIYAAVESGKRGGAWTKV